MTSPTVRGKSLSSGVIPHRGRLDHLDSLRGIAAITVIASHYVLAYGVPGWPWLTTHTPLHIWWDGPAAVSFFFVLSGLVLSLRHFRTTSAPNLENFHCARYAIARLCRVWLPYLVVMLLTVPVLKFSGQHLQTDPPSTPWMANFWKEPVTVKSLTRQAVDIRVANPGDGVKLLVPQAWSLSVEVVMSLLIPLGILGAGRSTTWFLAWAMIGTLLAGLSPFAFHFSLGIALAKHYRVVIAWLEDHAAIRIILAVVGLTLYTYNNFPINLRILQILNAGHYAQAIGSALIIAVSSSSPSVREWLSRGLVQHIGKISYSIYLVHMLILLCLVPRVLVALGGLPTWLSWWAGLGVTIASSIVISGPLYRYVEAPTMALGKWINLSSNPIANRIEKGAIVVNVKASIPPAYPPY